MRINCTCVRSKEATYSAISTEILTAAEANRRVKAAIKTSKIVDDVRVVERNDSFRRPTMRSTFRLTSPGITGPTL
tara:strand:+ start:95 stop:322 length:228 start_codon:yes stop_codon:yes gene_type:complete